MKKRLMFCLTLLFALGCSGCGTSEAEKTTSSAAADHVDMLYYKRLADGSMMAACYTEDGITRLGEDYYLIRVDGAEIQNAKGEVCELEDLTRGCPVRIQWNGAVMQSYPGQIAAQTITALSDEADPSVPAEENIQPKGGGAKWWVEEPVTEVPKLNIEYASADFICNMSVAYRLGRWSYSAGTDDSASGGSRNASLDGQTPQEWEYDDNNTIRRGAFDTIKLSLVPEPASWTVTAYPDREAAGTEMEPDEDGTLTLLDGDTIYVVEAVWDSGEYQGEAAYGFLVTEQS